MTTPTANDQLDRFESNLLSDLQAYAATTEPAPPSRERSWVGYALPAAAALVVGTAAVLVQGGGGQPAYAIDDEGDVVHLTINRAAGADQLEKDLAAHGIAADVTFLDDAEVCTNTRYVPSTNVPDKPLAFEVSSSGAASISIPKRALAENQTLVLVASESDSGEHSVVTAEVGITDGDVSPECVPGSIADGPWPDRGHCWPAASPSALRALVDEREAEPLVDERVGDRMASATNGSADAKVRGRRRWARWPGRRGLR